MRYWYHVITEILIAAKMRPQGTGWLEITKNQYNKLLEEKNAENNQGKEE